MSYYADEIREKITMPELLRHYGFELNRSNRMPCPFHNGVDNNFGVKDDFYHCFVCGASGDVIKFTMEYFGLTFHETVLKLNQDFALGLPVGEKLDRRKRLAMGKKSFLRKQERDSAIKSSEALKKEYNEALDEWVRLDKQLQKYKLLSNGADLHPLFVEAIKNIVHAEHRLECAEMELYKNERKN